MEIIIKYFVVYFVTALRYLLLSGIAFFICYYLLHHKIARAKIQERKATRKDFFREILHSLHASMVLAFMGYIVLFTPLKKHTLIYTNRSDYPLWWLPISLLLSLIIHDTYFYWMHRVLHNRKIFSLAHIVHHKSTNPSPWASYSFHFFEAITEGLVVFIIVFTLPIHPSSLILFTLVGFLINIYGHLGYEIMPKWFRKSWLFQIINTSVYHNLHHHKFKGNYGLYFRFWDRLMKTENPDYEKEYDKLQHKRFAINKVAKAATILPFLFICFPVFGQIEGKWISRETHDVVEIYKENNLFYGRAISSENKTENEKLTNKKLIILQDFKKQNESLYCCGTIYLPRRKLTVSGTMKVIDKNKLKVKGEYGLLSYSMIWDRM